MEATLFDALNELERRSRVAGRLLSEPNEIPDDFLVQLAIAQQLQRLAFAQEVANEHIAAAAAKF
jgi:hypothetical protein